MKSNSEEQRGKNVRKSVRKRCRRERDGGEKIRIWVRER